MPNDKIATATSAPSASSGYQSDWARVQFDTSTGGAPKFTDRDTIYPARQLACVVKIPLAGATIHAATNGILAWANPEPVSIIITRVLLDITTIATAACTFDIGTTAVSATTTSDNLLTGVDAHAATGLFDNITDKGTNGKSKQKLASGKWVTLDEKTGDATGLVGNLYIEYTTI
jgi:hypothetical protein